MTVRRALLRRGEGRPPPMPSPPQPMPPPPPHHPRRAPPAAPAPFPRQRRQRQRGGAAPGSALAAVGPPQPAAAADTRPALPVLLLVWPPGCPPDRHPFWVQCKRRRPSQPIDPTSLFSLEGQTGQTPMADDGGPRQPVTEPLPRPVYLQGLATTMGRGGECTRRPLPPPTHPVPRLPARDRCWTKTHGAAPVQGAPPQPNETNRAKRANHICVLYTSPHPGHSPVHEQNHSYYPPTRPPAAGLARTPQSWHPPPPRPPLPTQTQSPWRGLGRSPRGRSRPQRRGWSRA